MDTPNSTTQKRCGRKEKCIHPARETNGYLPATPEYFHRASKSPDGLQGWCKACTRAVKRQWEQDNPDRVKATKRKTRAKYKQEISEYNRQYHIDHHEQRLAYMAHRRSENRLYWNEYQQRWRATNPERVHLMRASPRYKLTHVVNGQNRRARIKAAGGVITKADVRLQYKSQLGKCWYCSTPLGTGYHIEHIIPIARGGRNVPENIVLSCPECNMSKGAKLPQEWNGRLF